MPPLRCVLRQKAFSARLLTATGQRHSTSHFSLRRSLALGSDKGIIK